MTVPAPRLDALRPGEPLTGRVAGEDWYARDLEGLHVVDAVLVDCDLTEVSTTGCAFDRVTFRNVRLNASTHLRSRFVGCTFEGSSWFDATFDGCKLTGSQVVGCTTRPLTVRGGDWSYVSLRQADLRGLQLDGVDLEEADLAEADLREATLRSCCLARASLRGARLSGASLVGSNLEGVDLAAADLRGVAIDAAQAVLVARSHGAVVL